MENGGAQFESMDFCPVENSSVHVNTSWTTTNVRSKKRCMDDMWEDAPLVKEARLHMGDRREIVVEQSYEEQMQILQQLQGGWNQVVSGCPDHPGAAWYQGCLASMDAIIAQRSQRARVSGADLDKWFGSFAKLNREQQIAFRHLASESYLRRSPIADEAIQSVLHLGEMRI
uniref:Uncharacterized protein n=1 Tax=Amphora coffeiformis TaxID=265554 RepID=A0A7S3PCT9_9STRA|mmetsp:Transcript_9616/g.19395  ORF Transcript_9616/g.19395 Transcript_9616/m.19395 type:complete len:172 (+) Transcript_9616:107-622(+)|eukprot:scaffold15910_cov193-Amphora_coffeaeformis.AAC.9